MSESEAPQAGPPTEDSPSPLRMITVMGAIGCLSGILIVATFQLTLPRITQNKEAALEQAIFEVVPGTAAKRPFNAVEGKLRPITMESPVAKKYYACYNDEGELIGVALEAAGQGFADQLKLLYGYSTEDQAIVGMKVLESKETPGLGDKIEKDPAFLANFDGLLLNLNEEQTAIVNPIKLVKPGEKEEPWQIESITGATISSKAVANILEGDTTTAVPIIEQNIEAMQEGAPE